MAAVIPRTLREIALRAAAGMTDPRRVPFLGYRRANEQYGLVARRDQAQHLWPHAAHLARIGGSKVRRGSDPHSAA